MRLGIVGTAVVLLSGGAAAAGVSQITYRTVFENPGPYGNGEVVSGSVWIDWTAPGHGEPGVAVRTGRFALLMNGRGSFILPEERPSDQIHEPSAPGWTPWIEGRRPAWLAGGEDGFRRPPVEPMFGLQYQITTNGDDLSALTATIASSASGIVYQQPPLDSIGELLVDEASFEVFRFRLTMPGSGSGVITVSPLGGGPAYYYTSPAGGAAQFDEVIRLGSTITFVPGPSPAVFILGGLAFAACRRRRFRPASIADL